MRILVTGLIRVISATFMCWGALQADTIATNHAIVDPTPEVKPCDSSSKGYYIAEMDLLDWAPTVAPRYKSFSTGYVPPGDSTGKLGGIPAGGLNEGRLRDDLRATASKANPNISLCRAAVAFVLGKPYDGNALADLSVTGRRTFAAFSKNPPQVSDVFLCAHQSLTPLGFADAQIQTAVDMAFNRAFLVLGILRAGGWPIACPERDALSPQYIAVSGEDDQPHRPVNVPSAEFPQFDLDVSVPLPPGRFGFPRPPLLVHTRYMIAHTTRPLDAEPASCAPTGRTVPADRVPVLAPDAEVILYIHGMDSRLEEALSFTRQIQALGRARHKNYTVVSMDLPTSGYADNVDHTTIAPLTDDGTAGGLIDGLGFSPSQYVVPILDFDENFIVSFVKALDQKLGPNHPLTSRLVAVVGGSLGGNLSMRLGRPRPDATWITNIVSWSPASIWPSLADNPLKHAGLAVPWYLAGGEAAYAQEDPGQRRSFFYGGYEWAGTIASFIPVTEPQAEYWYSDAWPCKAAYIRLSRLERYETYDKNFRLWHWRIAMEQMLFSHQITKPGTGLPLYLLNTKPMLLMCGMDDVGADLCLWARRVAPMMVKTPGHALFLNSTGHSIHAERPNFLARQVVDFIEPPPPPPPLPQLNVEVTMNNGKGAGVGYWFVQLSVTDATTRLPIPSFAVHIGGTTTPNANSTTKIRFRTCSEREPGPNGTVISVAVPCAGTVTVSNYQPADFEAGSG